MEKLEMPHRNMRKPIYLKDQEFFTQVRDLIIREDIIKPIFDKWIKEYIEDNLKSTPIEIEKTDYVFIAPEVLMAIPEKTKATPFKLYYNLKHNQLLSHIEWQINFEKINQNQLNELRNNKETLNTYIFDLIDKYIHQILTPDTILLLMIKDDVEAMGKKILGLAIREDTNVGILKKFGHGQLVEELEKLIKEKGLQKGHSVDEKIIQFFFNQLIKKGFNANKQAVRSKLTYLGYYSKKTKKT